jgi:hypothetical protein
MLLTGLSNALWPGRAVRNRIRKLTVGAHGIDGLRLLLRCGRAATLYPISEP